MSASAVIGTLKERPPLKQSTALEEGSAASSPLYLLTSTTEYALRPILRTSERSISAIFCGPLNMKRGSDRCILIVVMYGLGIRIVRPYVPQGSHHRVVTKVLLYFLLAYYFKESLNLFSQFDQLFLSSQTMRRADQSRFSRHMLETDQQRSCMDDETVTVSLGPKAPNSSLQILCQGKDLSNSNDDSPLTLLWNMSSGFLRIRSESHHVSTTHDRIRRSQQRPIEQTTSSVRHNKI